MRANRFISVVACLIAVGCSDVDDASNDAKVYPGGAPRVVDARSEFEAVCERADVVASVRNGEYLFKKAPVAFEALSEFMA